jgi:hypothetical protein
MARDVIAEKAAATRILAERHYQAEPRLTRIIHYSGSQSTEARAPEPIKLLEVNPATVSSRLAPVRFGPSPSTGIPFSVAIIEVTPGDYDRIEAGELKLPKHWQTGVEIHAIP